MVALAILVLMIAIVLKAREMRRKFDAQEAELNKYKGYVVNTGQEEALKLWRSGQPVRVSWHVWGWGEPSASSAEPGRRAS